MNAVRSLRRRTEPVRIDVSAHERFASALDRIAAATSVMRTREQDAERFARNGGTAADLLSRVELEAARLEQITQQLQEHAA